MENDPTPNPLPPTTPPPETVTRPTGPRRLLTFLIGLPLGFLVHFASLVALGIGLFSARGSNTTAIVAAMVLCVVSIAVAIPLLRRPTLVGFAFGILIGVALTALLTAQCAMTGRGA